MVAPRNGGDDDAPCALLEVAWEDDRRAVVDLVLDAEKLGRRGLELGDGDVGGCVVD